MRYRATTALVSSSDRQRNVILSDRNNRGILVAVPPGEVYREILPTSMPKRATRKSIEHLLEWEPDSSYAALPRHDRKGAALLPHNLTSGRSVGVHSSLSTRQSA